MINLKERLIICVSNILFSLCCGLCNWKIIGKENLDNAKKLNFGNKNLQSISINVNTFAEFKSLFD